MKRIDSANAQADKFGPGKNGFQGGNPSLNLDATYFTPDWCDHVQEEIANAIELLGTALDPTKRNQLATILQSIKNESKLPPGIYVDAAWNTPPAGWRVVRCNGQALPLDVYTGLLAIYQGDSANTTANWGYRCTDAANPNTTRNTTGNYIVLPKTRGRYRRDVGDGTGIANGFLLTDYLNDEFRSHNHAPIYLWNTWDDNNDDASQAVGGENNTDRRSGPYAQADSSTGYSGGGETRPYTYFCTTWLTY